MANKNEREKRRKENENLRAEIQKKFKALNKKLRNNGIDASKKPYMELDDLYCNLPAMIEGLSFHDININETVLMDLKWEDPTSDCLIKANEIFVHTFLDDCTLESCK